MMMFQAVKIVEQISGKNQNRCKKQKAAGENQFRKWALPQGKRQPVSKKGNMKHCDQCQKQHSEFFKKDPCFDLIIILSPERKCQISGNTGWNHSVFCDEKKLITEIAAESENTENKPDREKGGRIRDQSFWKSMIGVLHLKLGGRKIKEKQGSC